MRIFNGSDIVKISRLSKHVVGLKEVDSFITKCFSEDEISYCLNKSKTNIKPIIQSFAGKFACKEAASKALGTGICSEGIGLKDFEIENDDKGAPSLILHDRALEQASRLGITSISISISHEEDYAFASCVMLSEECEI